MALAVDATSVATSISSGTSLTWSHTCTGSNLALFVLPCIVDNNTAPWALISGITYNGVALRKIAFTRDLGGSELFTYIWVLAAPSTGANNIVVTLSENINVGSGFIGASAISFTGVHQTYPYRLPMTKGSGLTGVTTFSITLADALTGDFILGTCISHNSTITQDGAQTVISTNNGFGITAAQAFASAYRSLSSGNSLTWGQSPGQVFSGCAVTVRPDTDTPTQPMLDNINAGPAVGSAASSVTINNVLVSSGANFLYYAASYYNGTGGFSISGVTYGGVPLTKKDSQSIVWASGHAITEIWYLLAPASGTANIVATFGGAIDEFVSGSASFYLVDQSTPFGTVAKATASGSNFTVTVTSTTGALVTDVLYCDGSLQPNLVPTGAISYHAVNAVNNSCGASQLKPGGSSVVMNYTDGSGGSTTYNMMGVGLNFGAPPAAIVPVDGDGFFPPIGGGWDQNITVFQ